MYSSKKRHMLLWLDSPHTLLIIRMVYSPSAGIATIYIKKTCVYAKRWAAGKPSRVCMRHKRGKVMWLPLKTSWTICLFTHKKISKDSYIIIVVKQIHSSSKHTGYMLNKEQTLKAEKKKQLTLCHYRYKVPVGTSHEARRTFWKKLKVKRKIFPKFLRRFCKKLIFFKVRNSDLGRLPYSCHECL